MFPTALSVTQQACVQAESALANGKAQEALTLLDRIAPPKVSSEAAQLQFLRGRAMLDLRRFAEARPLLEAAVLASKGNAAYRMALAASLHFSGDLLGAEKQYREAMRLAPTAENPPFNLAGLLLQKGEHEAAMRAYQLALTLKPDFLDAMVAMAEICLTLQKLELADSWLNRAIAVGRPSENLECVLGHRFERLDQLLEAEAHFRRATEIDPTMVEAWLGLGRVLGSQGRQEEAREQLLQARTLSPENPKIAFLCDMFGIQLDDDQQTQPVAVPAAVVAELFNEYAPTFEKSLVENLSYRTPQHIGNMLEAERVSAQGAQSVLDLGCGTGLMAPFLTPFSSELIGVDLSPRMLKQAADRGYAELHEAEIVQFLSREERAFHLIVAADVLVYIGDLQALFTAVKRVMRPGARFCFSTETLHSDAQTTQNPGYMLASTGRFQHSSAYVEAQADAAGLTIIRADDVVLRTNAQQDVHGKIWLLQAR